MNTRTKRLRCGSALAILFEADVFDISPMFTSDGSDEITRRPVIG